MVEFAVTLPVLLLMAVGAADFSRLFLESTVIVGGTANAVKYGAQNNVTSSRTAIMAEIAQGTAADAAAQETVDRVCDCPNSPGAWVDCLSGTCNGYGLPRAYVRVRLQKNFTPIAPVPGIPAQVPIDLQSYMRVQ